jgi:predicted PurR-regulated permease PerM
MIRSIRGPASMPQHDRARPSDAPATMPASGPASETSVTLSGEPAGSPDGEPAPLTVRVELPVGEVARAGLVVLGLALGAYVLWHIHEVIFLLFLGILLATAIEPIVNSLRRGPFGRGTGVLAVYTATALTLGVVTTVTVPSLAAQSDAFVSSIPAKVAALRPYAAQLRPQPVKEAALRAIDRVGDTVKNPNVPVDEQSLLQFLATIGHSLISFMTVFFLAFYWLEERSTIKRALLRLVPPSHARGVDAAWLEVEGKLGGWVRGQIVVMLVMAVLAGVGFWVIGLPNPGLLGVLAGIAELVPMVGPFLAFAPAVLVALGISPWTTLMVIVYAVLIQQLESNLLIPRILGHSVGVSPLIVLLGILIGAILYGLPGAFLAVPIAAAIQVIVAYAIGMQEPGQVSADQADVSREAAAEAAAGAAATASPGKAAEAAQEAAFEALEGAPADPARAADAAERAVLTATAGDGVGGSPSRRDSA